MDAAPAHDAAPRPRGFWWTFGWGLLAFVAWVAGQAIVLTVFLLHWSGQHPGAPLDLSILETEGWLIAVSILLPTVVECAVLLFAARRSGWPVADYLGLRWPRRNDLMLGLVCVVILLVGSDLVSWLFGRELVPPFMTKVYHAARDAGAAAVLLFAAVVAAPIGEETMFRGFLFPGWAASRLGLPGTIVATAGLWALIHVQYDWFGIGQVFCIGLVFGWLRWRSGSTALTMLLHGIVNLSASIETAVIIEWLT